MTIGFIGDVHGDMRTLQKIHDEVVKYPDIKAIIQVGDFGFYPSKAREIRELKLQLPVYVIDGNHEDFHYIAARVAENTNPDGTLKNSDGTVGIHDNLFYVPRGTVLELDGRTIAFCGGAASVDKDYRIRSGMSWHPEEQITNDEMMTVFAAVAGKKIDIFVTHCPPQSTIQKHFDPMDLVRYFGLSRDWTDPSADKIEALWNTMQQPQLICGHMHRKIEDGNVRILNIDELFCM